MKVIILAGGHGTRQKTRNCSGKKIIFLQIKDEIKKNFTIIF